MQTRMRAFLTLHPLSLLYVISSLCCIPAIVYTSRNHSFTYSHIKNLHLLFVCYFFCPLSQEDPTKLPNFSRHRDDYRASLKASIDNLKFREWVIHQPVSPTCTRDTTGNRIQWETTGKQKISVHTLLPDKVTYDVIDEKTNPWIDPDDVSMEASEKLFQTRVRALSEPLKEWEVFLHVLTASDAGKYDSLSDSERTPDLSKGLAIGIIMVIAIMAMIVMMITMVEIALEMDQVIITILLIIIMTMVQ